MAAVQASRPHFWKNPEFARMTSVEELDSSLTLLTHLCSPVRTVTHNDTIMARSPSGILTPPGTPHSARALSPDTDAGPCASQAFNYNQADVQDGPVYSSVLRMPPNALSAPIRSLFSQTKARSATTGANVASAGNVVAIDNKIEQAMDLVKTHLTFAVREEVEVLRSTIVELEAKVASLEGQNQVLKQFAPAEVVANLSLLVQNAQQQKQLQQQLQQLPTAASQASAQSTVPSMMPLIVNTPATVQVSQQPSVPVIPPVGNVAVTPETVMSTSGTVPDFTAAAPIPTTALSNPAAGVDPSAPMPSI